MKFYNRMFPNSSVTFGAKTVHFENGELETFDTAVIEKLKKMGYMCQAEIEEVKPVRSGKKKE